MSPNLSLDSTWLPLNKDGKKLGDADVFVRKARFIYGSLIYVNAGCGISWVTVCKCDGL